MLPYCLVNLYLSDCLRAVPLPVKIFRKSFVPVVDYHKQQFVTTIDSSNTSTPIAPYSQSLPLPAVVGDGGCTQKKNNKHLQFIEEAVAK